MSEAREAEIKKPVTINAFDLLIHRYHLFYLPWIDALKLISVYQTWKTNVIQFLLYDILSRFKGTSRILNILLKFLVAFRSCPLSLPSHSF